MRLRPCIDIHNGKVKQIVGSSLRDDNVSVKENFVSPKEPSYYSGMYRDLSLPGGHVIVLNSRDSEYYEASKKAALSALSGFRNGMQYGGGINNENAAEFLDAGASHVIVTSFVFKDGVFNRGNLNKLKTEVGKERIVLDLSCRKKPDGKYYVTTDRWQKYTDFEVTAESLKDLSGDCSEFLIHAVDAEGSRKGVDTELIKILAEEELIPVTYAGGVGSLSDADIIKREGKGRIDFTVGSALDIFGGDLSLKELMEKC